MLVISYDVIGSAFSSWGSQNGIGRSSTGLLGRYFWRTLVQMSLWPRWDQEVMYVWPPGRVVLWRCCNALSSWGKNMIPIKVIVRSNLLSGYVSSCNVNLIQ